MPKKKDRGSEKIGEFLDRLLDWREGRRKWDFWRENEGTFEREEAGRLEGSGREGREERGEGERILRDAIGGDRKIDTR